MADHVPGSGGRAYLKAVTAVLEELAEGGGELADVGARIGASVADGGVVHVFGSGHSRLAAEEVAVRAGTLSSVTSVWPERGLDRLERTPGLGASVLSASDLRAGEVLLVVSQSGINPLPIDVARAAGERGAQVVGVGSAPHSRAVASRHPDGVRLLDVVDVFLDTRMPAGDALVELDGLDGRCGPASTFAAAALLHAALVEAVAWMLAHGYEPPVRVSRNLPEGDRRNLEFIERYAARIPDVRYGA
jgi:uncharacterized phosphosugar-binding protein